MLALRRLLIGRLLARERLRLVLMTPHEICRLLDVILLDFLPLGARALGFGFFRGLLTLLLFLQMLTLKSLGFRIMLLLKLSQLFRAIALGFLVLLEALALELLQ